MRRPGGAVVHGSGGNALESRVLDANSLFDLHSGDILANIFMMGHEYATVDMVISKEVLHIKEEWLLGLGLKVYQLDGRQLSLAMHMTPVYNADKRGPGLVDLAVLVLAKSMGARLVTRDGRLKEAAGCEGVALVHPLTIVKELAKCGVLAPDQAIHALEQILQRRQHFPRDPTAKVIAELRMMNRR